MRPWESVPAAAASGGGLRGSHGPAEHERGRLAKVDGRLTGLVDAIIHNCDAVFRQTQLCQRMMLLSPRAVSLSREEIEGPARADVMGAPAQAGCILHAREALVGPNGGPGSVGPTDCLAGRCKRSSSAIGGSSCTAGDHVGNLSRADAAWLSLDEGQPKGFALLPVVADQVADVIAGVGVFAASDLGVDPLAHRVGQRMFRGPAAPPMAKIANTSQSMRSKTRAPIRELRPV
jgi:hypothetical protein